MTQFTLFPQTPGTARLPTIIERDGDWLKIPEGVHTIPATHGLHRFPGKFIPNLPRFLIREIIPNDTDRSIFDPFCGSGTTVLEAALEGRRFLGTDVDPLSVLIAAAKITPLSEQELAHIQRIWLKHDYSDSVPSLEPQVPNLRHWFSERAIRQLTGIKRRCLSLSENEKRFCLVVFSSILRRVSKADDQTQKTYVSGTLEKRPPEPRSLFPLFLERAIGGMSEYVSLLPSEPRGNVIVADARTFRPDRSIDDVVTSPPYIDSIDYMYNQMLEYFWLLPELGLSSYDDFRRLRRVPMGFRRDPEAAAMLLECLGDLREEFERTTCRVAQRSTKEAEAIRAFFVDYLTHLRNIHASQRAGGRYVCVVGNSLIQKVMVSTVDYLIALHYSTGYKLVDRFSYEIRRHYMKFPRRSNSGTIKMDHILVFERG